MAPKGKATAGWTPPKDADKLELSEFAKWENVGDVMLGRVLADSYRERPDPTHPDKIMKSVILSPVVVIPTTGEPMAYHSLAVGLSVHLDLLLPNVKSGGEDGNAIAIVWEGERPSAVKGQRASRQFAIYRLTEQQLKAEIAKVANVDDLPF